MTDVHLDPAIFKVANSTISNVLPDITPFIPDVSALIPKDTLSQFEKITKMNDLIMEQISKPSLFLKEFDKISELNKLLIPKFHVPESIITQIRHAADVSMVAAASFQIPSGTLKAMENIQKINLDCLYQGSKALEILSSINPTFLSSINPIFNIGFDWGGITESISKSFDFTKEKEFSKFEYNWAGFLTLKELEKLYELWKKGETEKVKGFFYEWFSDKGKLDALIHDLGKNKLFTPRMHILEKALSAHLDSKYELSIPILLSQIDGIFIERHKDLDEKIHAHPKCKSCGKKITINLPLTASNISKHILGKQNNYLPYFLEHIIDTFENLRNDILHGKKLDYADKDLSTKLIITLLELNI